jgi:hypothetical protein
MDKWKANLDPWGMNKSHTQDPWAKNYLYEGTFNQTNAINKN